MRFAVVVFEADCFSMDEASMTGLEILVLRQMIFLSLVALVFSALNHLQWTKISLIRNG